MYQTSAKVLPAYVDAYGQLNVLVTVTDDGQRFTVVGANIEHSEDFAVEQALKQQFFFIATPQWSTTHIVYRDPISGKRFNDKLHVWLFRQEDVNRAIAFNSKIHQISLPTFMATDRMNPILQRVCAAGVKQIRDCTLLNMRK